MLPVNPMPLCANRWDTTQEVQNQQIRCQDRRCRLQPKEKIVNVEPPTVLNEKELVAVADECCSFAAPPNSAESSPKVAHCIVVKFASMRMRPEKNFGGHHITVAVWRNSVSKFLSSKLAKPWWNAANNLKSSMGTSSSTTTSASPIRVHVIS